MTEQPKSTLLNSPLSKLPSPEMQRKVKEMIRKKASLYGIEELARPSVQSKVLLFATRLASKNTRSKSSLGRVPSTKGLKSARESTKYDEEGEPIIKAAIIPSYKLDSKTNQQKLFPPLNNLKNLIENERQLLYVFRDKLDYDLNDVVYQYLKILELVITHESHLFAHKISPHKGILIPTLQFLCQSLLQCQFLKMVLVFAIIGLNLCEFYKQLDRMGKFLFIVSKVLRKMEKYEECELTLKKALEYVWFVRGEYRGNGEKERETAGNQKDNADNKGHKRNRSNISQQPTSKHHSKSLHKQPQLKHIESSLNSQLQSPSKKPSKIFDSHTQPHRKHLQQEFTNLQLQIYNQLSYCLLQLNKKEESKVFGQKYEIGYLQKESNSSVMALSRDLIGSAQKRIVAWQRVDKRRFDLVFGIELDQYLAKYGQTIKDKFQQVKFIKALKVNIDLLIDNLFKKDVFFYEVPLITQLKDKQLEQYKQSHPKLPVLTQKFVYKKKSLTEGGRRSSIQGGMKKFKNENVGGNKIFNYRGVGLSRTKLTSLFREYIRFLEARIGNKEVGKLPPVFSYTKNDQHQ